MPPSPAKRAAAREFASVLARAIPEPRCELRHDGPWQLLVATILSAQCTDERVNAITPALFRRWPTPAALAAAKLSEVERVVRSTGFYRNKARAIVGASREICERFGGEVPRAIEDAVSLPGVARKTANLVLGTGLGIPSGIVVDTHVGRVARRLGLSEAEAPAAVERDLCALFPRAQWIDVGHRLLLHGRVACVAREPRCTACPLAEDCPSATGSPEGARRAREVAEAALVATRGEG